MEARKRAGPATPEMLAWQKKHIGSGLILSGVKRPPSSEKKLPDQPEANTPATQATAARRDESGITPEFQQALDRARINAEKPRTREEMWAVADRIYGTKKASPSE